MADTAEKVPTYASIRDLAYTRQILLDAGARVFAEKGLAGTRIDDLVTASGGVNRSMIYYIFGSKHGLYREVLKHILEQTRESMLKLFYEHGGRGNLLQTSVFMLLDIYHANPQWAKLLLREILDGGADFQWAIQSIPDFHHSKQTAIAMMEQAKAQNLLRVDNPHTFILFVQVLPLVLPIAEPVLDMLFPDGESAREKISQETWRRLLKDILDSLVNTEQAKV